MRRPEPAWQGWSIAARVGIGVMFLGWPLPVAAGDGEPPATSNPSAAISAAADQASQDKTSQAKSAREQPAAAQPAPGDRPVRAPKSAPNASAQPAGRGVARAEAAKAIDQIRELIASHQLDEALSLLETSLRKHSDPQLSAMRAVIAGPLARAGRHVEAAQQLQLRAQAMLVEPDPSHALLRRAPATAALMVRSWKRAGQLDRGIAAVDELLKVLDEAAEHPPGQRAWAAAELRALQVESLAQAQRKEAARELLAVHRREAEQAAAADAEAAAIGLIFVEKIEAKLATTEHPHQAVEIHDRFAQSLLSLLREPGQSQAVTAVALDQLLALIMSPDQQQAEAAARWLEELQTLVAAADGALKLERPRLRPLLTIAERHVASQRKMVALIGQEAADLTVEAWVQGLPVSSEDLRGKVVLLDFWAVWCGPCITAFPDLRRWYEEHADDGLVVVGLTRYYQRGWDASTQQTYVDSQITPQGERAMLMAFAQHHRLNYRLAVLPRHSRLYDFYGVTGIPHVVLIDRQGKIRLVLAGSGPENSRAIESMLKQLVAEPIVAQAD